MTDIVERLRTMAAECGVIDCNEAADEIERLRLDAARYRWLRSQTLDDPEIWIAVDSAKHPSRWGLGGDDPDGCDAAIDAAMKR